MFEWVNYHSVHVAIRVVTGVYFTALVGWTLYKHFHRGQSDDSKRVGGDILEQDDEDEEDEEEDEDVEIKRSATVESDGDITSDHESENLSDDEQEGGAGDIVDIEDIEINAGSESKDTRNGVVVGKRPKRAQDKKIDYTKFTEEQLTERLRGDLSKQGYRLIETHSAVKICRWTKNSMRGRGGCYKHTFYGIKSYQCMEMTPNLACASKCTFCWRHHKNPTGTSWKWKMDAPDVIVEQGIKNHLDMVKQLKGVPGVTEERFADAQTVHHCALSLVGEPIFYPRINELLEILHSKHISTFLVTNAQFPEAMRNLVPVTQLYVSIDAPNKEALKKIDRPLYRDFWERYIECLEIVREKKQRTVYRLTLVQKANMEDLEGYAKLVQIGQPDFIEIKGVTYCGTSKANKLTMENVPWHEQVIEFAKELLEFLDNDLYELACEHSHSNCTLIANKKFEINGRWHTWINYAKYFELIEAQANGTGGEFNSLDYAAETPSWAIIGSEEAGFDPEHMRWVRKDHKLKLLNERIAAATVEAQNCASETTTIDNDLPVGSGVSVIEQH